MLKRILPVFILLLLITGCNNSQKASTTTFIIKNDMLFEKTFKAEKPPELVISVENCNIIIVSHDKNEVKFSIEKEAIHIENKSDNKKDDNKKDDNKKLLEIKIDIQQIGNKITCKSIPDKNENSDTNVSNIIITIPKNVSSMQFKLNKGTLEVRDDLRCQFLIEAGICNVKINRLVGSITAKIKDGDFSILSGRLSTAQCFIENEGNISVKSELDKDGKYVLETNKGNINLLLPENTKPIFESAGIIEANEFVKQDSGIPVSLKSKLGRITMKKVAF